MKRLDLAGIMDMVTSDVAHPEDVIKRIFEWDYDRSMAVAKWVLGFGASLAATVVVGLINKKNPIDAYDIIYAGSGPIVVIIAGAYRMWRVRKIDAEYIAAIKLLGSVKMISPFLSRYRRSAKNVH